MRKSLPSLKPFKTRFWFTAFAAFLIFAAPNSDAASCSDNIKKALGVVFNKKVRENFLTDRRNAKAIARIGENAPYGIELSYRNPYLSEAQVRTQTTARIAFNDALGRIRSSELDPVEGQSAPGGSGTIFVKDLSIRRSIIEKELQDPQVIEQSTGSVSGIGVVNPAKNSNLLDGADSTDVHNLYYNSETGYSYYRLYRDDYLSRTNRGYGGIYSEYTYYLRFKGDVEDFKAAQNKAERHLRATYLHREDLSYNYAIDLLKDESAAERITESDYLQFAFDEGISRRFTLSLHLVYDRNGNRASYFIREVERGNPEAGVEVLLRVPKSSDPVEEASRVFPEMKVAPGARPKYLNSSDDFEAFALNLLPK